MQCPRTVRLWRWETELGRDEAAPSECESALETRRVAGVARITPDGTRLAAAARDVDVAVWSLERAEGGKAEPLWRARNLPNDNLDLPVPVWTTDVRFAESEPSLIVATTGYVDQRLRGEVRLYDVRARRRPMLRAIAPLGDEALSSLALSTDGKDAFIGSVTGGMCRLDARKGLAPCVRYKGAAGAIREIDVHATLPIVACASLDRMLRVYSARGGGLVERVYLKQRQSALLLSRESSAETDAYEAGDGSVRAMLAGVPNVEEGVEGEEGEAEEEAEGEEGEEGEAEGEEGDEEECEGQGAESKDSEEESEPEEEDDAGEEEVEYGAADEKEEEDAEGIDKAVAAAAGAAIEAFPPKKRRAATSGTATTVTASVAAEPRRLLTKPLARSGRARKRRK